MNCVSFAFSLRPHHVNETSPVEFSNFKQADVTETCDRNSFEMGIVHKMHLVFVSLGDEKTL